MQIRYKRHIFWSSVSWGGGRGVEVWSHWGEVGRGKENGQEFVQWWHHSILTTQIGDCQRVVAGVAVHKQNDGPFSLQEWEENVLNETQEHFLRDPSIWCSLEKCLLKALHGIESRISAVGKDQERWQVMTVPIADMHARAATWWRDPLVTEYKCLVPVMLMTFLVFGQMEKPDSSALNNLSGDVRIVGSTASMLSFISSNHDFKLSLVTTAFSLPRAWDILSESSGCCLKNAAIHAFPGLLSLKTVFSPLSSRIRFTMSLKSFLVWPKPHFDSSTIHFTSLVSSSLVRTVLCEAVTGLLPHSLSPNVAYGMPKTFEAFLNDICFDLITSSSLSTASCVHLCDAAI